MGTQALPPWQLDPVISWMSDPYICQLYPDPPCLDLYINYIDFCIAEKVKGEFYKVEIRSDPVIVDSVFSLVGRINSTVHPDPPPWSQAARRRGIHYPACQNKPTPISIALLYIMSIISCVLLCHTTAQCTRYHGNSVLRERSNNKYLGQLPPNQIAIMDTGHPVQRKKR